MKTLRRSLAGLALAFAIMMGVSTTANAACWYGPPTGGYQVNYHNCQGPYFVSHFPPYYQYRCWADYDVWAEWFRGEVDRWVWVWAVQRCYA